jgi:trehalose 6-phosphate phosphatase
MDWLWSRWSQVEERIGKAGHALLLLDYDGTLTPCVASPEQATLPSATQWVLRRLSRSPKVTLALISGRALGELRQLVGLRGLTYIGNHGLEMSWRGRRRVVAIPESCRRAIDRIRPCLARIVTDTPGAHLEDKGLSVSVHYRSVPGNQVPHLRTALRLELLPFIRSGELTAFNGKKVIEIRPKLNWTKGHTAVWLIGRMRHRSVLPIYIGDDRTDEDAFDALTGGITIRVGAHRGSKARFYVRNIREVVAFLEWLATRFA